MYIRILIISLFSALLTSCADEPVIHDIQFKLMYGENSISCGTAMQINGQSWQLSQFQFYIHALQFRSQGQWVPATFEVPENNDPHVKLIGGVCNSNFDWKMTVKSPVAPKNIDAVQFKIGVPFELNHNNPLTQKSPLNQSDMFWVWQTGHKFLRLELTSETNDWIYHLGSTGCHSESAVRAPAKACKNPNVATVRIDVNELKTIGIDIKPLFEGIDLNSESSCKSEPANELCKHLLERTGLNSNSTIFKSL
ncbi:MbnP family copper-binding protein [Pleionea sediminis]|uniref:MbnP family copper-binding protein n=1 Tax=Pleionea sediminis TaxID=2569479 RepID=UPI00197BD05C|nr:MbnP family copper-binding protein [Pleionea sediminis]